MTGRDEADNSAEQRDRRTAWGLLALTGALFVAFNVVFLPRLTNVNFGDIEFTGWSGPMGSRLLHGDRPYVDFVLPIPPGSFLATALLEKIVGRPLLLEELGLNAAIHLAMGGLAYFMARAVTSRKIAVLTAIATLATVIQLNKECAYDHTAQVVAWLSIAAGLHALLSSDQRARSRGWVLAGVFAALTLAFKQSTAVGCVGGWFLGFAYLAGIDLWSKNRGAARAWLGPLSHYTRGLALGLAGVWLMLVLLGSTVRAFFQAVFVDASMLKGGPKLLVENLIVFLFDYPAFPASLLFLTLFVLVGLRVFAVRGSLGIGDEPIRASLFERWEVVTISATVTLGFGAGIWFLVERKHAYPIDWVLVIDGLKELPSLGLVATAAVFVAHLVRTREVGAGARHDEIGVGHALNATVLAALACSLMHNTSAPEFRPYYDNNAIIPLTFLTLFVVLDRARLSYLSAALLVAFLGSAAGNKYFRAMTATIPMGPRGYLAGMRVNDHGIQIVHAADRARALSTPSDTVLVLPEDLEIESLIGRPRPDLMGAIVFVDQYAPRLAHDDIERLDEHPPKVIVIHPRKIMAWQRFFRIWSGKSGAERVIDHVLFHMIPREYKLDSTYPTTFLWEPGLLDVYVRLDHPRSEADREKPIDDSGGDPEGGSE